jgi:hypothetical protein
MIGFDSSPGDLPMRRLRLVCAVAVLAATALPFAAQNSALAYCRGCIVEAVPLAVADSARAEASSAEAARAEAFPAEALANPPISAQCHMEKQYRSSKGQRRWRFVEICE